MWRALLTGLVVGLMSCAEARPVVKPEPFDFGGTRASTRDFPGKSICEAEPRFLLDELSSVNGLLSRFLKDTAATTNEEWTDKAMELAEEGVERLPPLLTLHERSLKTLASCDFGTQGAYPRLRERGGELVAETRARLESIPGALKAVRQARAKAEWDEKRFVQQEQARRGCPARPGAPVIYFAWRERGRTTWLFCDGTQAVRENGDNKPTLEGTSAAFTRGKRPSEAAYLSAIGRYPAAAVLVAPGDEAVSVW